MPSIWTSSNHWGPTATIPTVAITTETCASQAIVQGHTTVHRGAAIRTFAVEIQTVLQV